jgi:hypothetical protein
MEKTRYSYPIGYAPKEISDQAAILERAFPRLMIKDKRLFLDSLPPGAEARFIFPYWKRVASIYGGAVQRALELLKEQRQGRFYNWRVGALEKFRQNRLTDNMLLAFWNRQGEGVNSDFLVVPAQFALRYRNRSIEEAREAFVDGEFGLGAFEVGCMLLTHPERLVSYADLWIDCPGDEFSFYGSPDFSSSSNFSIGARNLLEFNTGLAGSPSNHYGSVSGFLE